MQSSKICQVHRFSNGQDHHSLFFCISNLNPPLYKCFCTSCTSPHTDHVSILIHPPDLCKHVTSGLVLAKLGQTNSQRILVYSQTANLSLMFLFPTTTEGGGLCDAWAGRRSRLEMKEIYK